MSTRSLKSLLVATLLGLTLPVAPQCGHDPNRWPLALRGAPELPHRVRARLVDDHVPVGTDRRNGIVRDRDLLPRGPQIGLGVLGVQRDRDLRLAGRDGVDGRAVARRVDVRRHHRELAAGDGGRHATPGAVTLEHGVGAGDPVDDLALAHRGRLQGRVVEVDTGRREARVNGTVVALATREYDLLHHLASRPQRLVTKDELIAIMKGEQKVIGTYTLNPSEKSKQIDLKTEGKYVMKGIYELDGNSLKLCFNEDPTGARATAFESKKGSPNDLFFVLKRRKD